MADFIKGDDVILEFYNPVAADWQPVACLTANSLNNTRAMIESQTKCDQGLLQRDPGSISYEFTFEGQETDDTVASGLLSFDKIKEIWYDASIPVYCRINTALGGDPATVFYYGTGPLSDLNLDAPAGDEFATFSGTVTVSGLLSLYDSGDVPTPTSGTWLISGILTNAGKQRLAVVDSLLASGIANFFISYIDAFGFDWKNIITDAYINGKTITMDEDNGAQFIGTVTSTSPDSQGGSFSVALTSDNATFTEGASVVIQFS